MTTTTVPAASISPRHKAWLAAAILVPFGVFSMWVVASFGYTGFLVVARDEPWALQMLLDLMIASAIGLGWLAQDARKRGIAAWPYFVLTLFLGSIGLLAYVVRRGFAPREA